MSSLIAGNCDVLVSIVNYRTAERTLACVQSLLENTSSRLAVRIIITDNDSGDNDRALLTRWQQAHTHHALVVLHSANSGFAGGHTVGVQAALQAGVVPQYVWILNSDTLLINDCLAVLCAYMSAHAQVGLASPQLYNDDGTPHQTAEYFPTLGYKIFGRGYMRLLAVLRGRILAPLSDEYTQPTQVQVVSGAAMFIRATAYHTAGGLDTRYFLYCEEEDIALTMQKYNYHVAVVPQAKITHSGSASTEVRSIAIRKEYYISLFKLYAKWFSPYKAHILRQFLAVKIARKYPVDGSALEIAEFVRHIY
jgi:GT2 family glycosyltransferase